MVITIEQLRNFLINSEEYLGLTMRGCYDLPMEDFISSLKEFVENDSNPLFEHAQLTYLRWQLNDLVKYGTNVYTNPISKETSILARTALKKKTFWNIDYMMNYDQRKQLRDLLKLDIQSRLNKRLYKNKRKVATIYTASKKIRALIFARDGKICRQCEATTNLHLDHVIPVKKNGKNEISNLQVLCRSCNSKKSSKL